MHPAPALVALYVPGDRPERFDKAARSGADIVVIDLEDAVAPDRKAVARRHVAEYLAARPDVATVVRVNAADTEWHDEDLRAIRDAKALAAVWLPKVHDSETVVSVRRHLDRVPIHAIIESAQGVQNLSAIASTPGVESVALGEADLRSELGITDPAGIDVVRLNLVIAAAAAGLPPPMMSAWTDLGDPRGLEASCRAGRSRGFLGRTAIHPRQVAVIRRAFLPTADEVARARAVLDALDVAGGAVAVLPDGGMVDRAMRRGAERILALAARTDA